MSEGLLSLDRIGILKSVRLMIPNDMDTVESVTSGDIKPFLLGLPAYTVIFLMDFRCTLDLGITAVF